MLTSPTPSAYHKYMKKLLILTASFLFAAIFLLFKTPAFAQLDPCQTSPSPTETILEGTDVEFSTSERPECLDEADKIIDITFYGLESDKSGYIICTGDSACLREEGFVPGINGPDILDNFILGLKSDSKGNVTVKGVCGAGSSKVKTDCGGTVYFHGGNVYALSIGTLIKEAYYKPIKIGGFYVHRTYPSLSIYPGTDLRPGATITVNLGNAINNSFRPGGWRRNNYQILMIGNNGYRQGGCLAFTSENESGKRIEFQKLSAGKYTITVREQVDDDNPTAWAWVSVSVFPSVPNPPGCKGGFTYYEATCIITSANNKEGGTCDDPLHYRQDPKGEEYRTFLKDLAALNKVAPGAILPCGSGEGDINLRPGDCKTINSAIGPINVTPKGFIETIFRFILTIAGFGAIIIIIYSGYILITSGGDKEKIAGARETITSAVVGLLFIIFSIVILEIIGVDILKIPGLTR